MKIYVAGHNGLVGSAIVRKIEADGIHEWIGKTRSELDLLDRQAVLNFLDQEKPDAVIIAAAKVGGIVANSRFPVEFLMQNLGIQANLMEGAHLSGVERVLFLGSSCIYPKFAPQPIREESLLTGPLEPTNEAYALAKIAGLKLIEAFRSEYNKNWISAMPTNIYGPGDNYDLENSHVLPALIRKFHDAKVTGSEKVLLWGTGSPKREFLFSEDLADACLFLLENYNEKTPINVGSGEEVEISLLASKVAAIVGFKGEILWDTTKPDGTPRKLLDGSLLQKLGWKSKVPLNLGIQKTYESFITSKLRT